MAHLVDHSGNCNTCHANAAGEQVLECYFCKGKFHADCNGVTPFACKSFVKSFKTEQNKGNNFFFICNPCITNRETTEAATLKEQMAEVIASVSKLTKEVAELKTEKRKLNVRDAADMPKSSTASVSKNEQLSEWRDVVKKNRIKPVEKKVTCLY